MANTIYQKTICDLIDFREDVKEKFSKLVDSTNENLTFSKNEDGTMAIYVKYKNYDIAINITEKEVFNYALQRGKKSSEAINEIIEKKICEELLQER